MITSDKLASLVAEAWPLSLSPLNIMSGFKKTGIYPINPSEVTDRQIAPSKPFQQSPTESSQDGSEDPFFSLDKVELLVYVYENICVHMCKLCPNKEPRGALDWVLFRVNHYNSLAFFFHLESELQLFLCAHA